MIVVPGPSSVKLGKAVADLLQAGKVSVDYKVFPDGESYLRVDGSVKGEDVVLVNTTYPQQDKRVIELLLLIQALKDLGASKVRAVVPYMAYSRQDSMFREGETVSISTLFRLIEAAGCDEFLTADLHKERSLNAFKIKSKNMYASSVIANYLKGAGLENPYVLSPDRGSLAIAKRVGEILGADYGNFAKTRDRITGAVTTSGDKINARGRDIVITDDLISTGGTIANACRIVREGGARRVIAVCTHPLLVAGAYERMKAAGLDEVIGTDTVESEISRISVAPLIASSLRGQTAAILPMLQ